MVRSRRCTLPLLLALGAMLATRPAKASGLDLPDSSIAAAQRIIHQTTMQQYAEALAQCHLLQQRHPEHPIGYFFEAATRHARMLDYEDYSEQEVFHDLAKKVVSRCRALLRRQPENSVLYFFWGGALGYEAYFLGKDNHMLQALKGGLDSIQLLERALALDPSNYDVYLGIGAYKYYRSKYSSFLKWLPFVGDERERGIAMIRDAIEHGTFSQPAAMNALIWIYADIGKYQAAQELIDRALQRYPGSRFFLWGQAKIAQHRQEWQTASAAYHEILKSYADDGKGAPVNEVICYVGLAEIAQAEGDADTAIDLANKALAIEVGGPGQKKVQDYRKRAEKIVQAYEGG